MLNNRRFRAFRQRQMRDNARYSKPVAIHALRGI